MDIKKILKSKSFSKRMELILSEIRTADRATQDEAISAAFEVAKTGSDLLELAGLALFVKSPKSPDILSKMELLCDGFDSQLPDVVALYAIAGKTDKVISLLKTAVDVSFLNKLQLAWVVSKFTSMKAEANVLAQEAIDAIGSTDDEWMLDCIAKWKATPPQPQVDSTCLRFHLDDSSFNWDGSSK